MLHGAVAAAAVALLMGVVGTGTAPARAGTAPVTPAATPDKDAFYTPPDPLPAVPAGTVLRSREVTVKATVIPVPFKAYQILYRSTDTQGRPDAVSGTILLPLIPSAQSPRPLVSYAVGTHGLGPQCAPSYQMVTGIDPELALMSLALQRGWAVVVTDYEGSGTPGPHVYAAGRTTGHAVLDAARAAQRFPAAGLDPAGPVGVWGYSEGGLGASWAGELQPGYAPELRLAGVASGGTPADLALVASKLDGGPFSGLELAAAVGLARAYPDAPFDSILNDSGKAAVARIKTQCQWQFTSEFGFRRISDFTTVADPLNLPAWKRILAENKLGQRHPGAPVLLYHATFDELIPVAGARELAAEYCRKDVKVQYTENPLGGEHVTYAVAGAPGAVRWLGNRFAGRTPPSSCR